MKNVCDKYNRAIDSIRQLVSDSRIHVLIDVTNSGVELRNKNQKPSAIVSDYPGVY